ncbi:MAG: leucyl aminopeptidase [Rhodospirillaceae bacterium]|nr:leucyl aminopeptidase [Rhodospirillaceae bacterium]
MKIAFSEISVPSTGTLIVGVMADGALTPSAKDVDERMSGALARAVAASVRFNGKKNTTLLLNAPAGLDLARVLLIGLGKAGEIDKLQMQALGGRVVGGLNKMGETEASLAIDAPDGCPLSLEEMVGEIAFGAHLAAYRFDKYRTKQKEEDKPTLETLTLMSANTGAAEAAAAPRQRVGDGVYLSRNLVSEPSNVKYPATIVEDIEALSAIGIDVELLHEDRMRELGMGAILGVGQGSRRESYIAIMRWNGAENQNEQPIAFVGKGVTFDAGGISIKPSGGMEEMKYDMAGAGAVIGLMKALAGRKARANVVGVVGLVENMPDGNAQRPGDVVTTMSGQTIEVINTDAEGRLVLSDALWYTQKTFKPKFMVDLATLTGAIIVALGTYQAGLFSNNDELAERLTAAGKASGEELWRLPLGPRYDKDINSEIADMKNVGKGREAGSVTAAQLLERFVEETPWAHLDIAGMAWMKRGDDPIVPKGASGFGVRLLDKLVADYYES